MNALMVDLETLSTRQDACILSIGAVLFDPHHEQSVQELVDHGLFLVVQPQRDRHTDPFTALWWMEQSEEARAALRSDHKMNLGAALRDLHIYSRNAEIVWSHGKSFDLSILQHACEQAYQRAPWKHSTMRDTRTLFSLLSEGKENQCWPDNPQKHHPVWDAACQAVAVQRAYAFLGISSENEVKPLDK